MNPSARTHHMLPTICPQLQTTTVNYGDVFQHLNGSQNP